MKLILLILFIILIYYYLLNPIKEVYYINIDFELKRKKTFLNNYLKQGFNNIPLIRISGIVPDFGNEVLSKGELGCALSHMKVLNIISRKKKYGWYLICEDDCIGNFNKIYWKTFLITRFRRNVKIINLYCPIHLNPGKKFGSRTTCYMVTPEGAKICKNTILRFINKYPCDIALNKSSIISKYSRHIHIMEISNLKSSIQKVNNL